MGIGQAQNNVDMVAVAIDKDKSSQYAIKWTVENILTRSQALTLLHIKHRTAVSSQTRGTVPISEVTEEAAKAHKSQLEAQANGLFLLFRCFCTKKDVSHTSVWRQQKNSVLHLQYELCSAIGVSCTCNSRRKRWFFCSKENDGFLARGYVGQLQYAKYVWNQTLNSNLIRVQYVE